MLLNRGQPPSHLGHTARYCPRGALQSRQGVYNLRNMRGRGAPDAPPRAVSNPSVPSSPASDSAPPAPVVPSYRDTLQQILSLAVPSLGTVMIDPLMSLVDVAVVGNVSTLQLAAMGPCSSIFGIFFMVFYFINTSTCNFVGRETDNEKASEAVRWRQKTTVFECQCLISQFIEFHHTVLHT